MLFAMRTHDEQIVCEDCCCYLLVRQQARHCYLVSQSKSFNANNDYAALRLPKSRSAFRLSCIMDHFFCVFRCAFSKPHTDKNDSCRVLLASNYDGFHLPWFPPSHSPVHRFPPCYRGSHYTPSRPRMFTPWWYISLGAETKSANLRGNKYAGVLVSTYDSFVAHNLVSNLLVWEHHATHQFLTY
ncbi:hypothetical protein PanWU01x14_253700 [Parasponia andersonii]|uniref:Uncharacterized protein n=1 Tax=Parasponia andersonii TaxID=3476 RepID=A0A2P5BBI3_PARAD|nr:hypothetical protein PanWU01x14_253700 [Parasponia andersonii]